MQLLVGERGARLGRRDEAGREVDRRAVEVAVAHDHVAERDADAQLRQPRAPRTPRADRARARTRRRARSSTNITASPMRFDDVGARGRDHVAGRRLERGRASTASSSGSSSCREARVAREVGEPDRELHDVERRRRRADVAVAPADRLEVVAVQGVERVGDAAGAALGDCRRTRGRRRRTAASATSGASMFERSSATSASATRPTASPSVRTSCKHRFAIDELASDAARAGTSRRRASPKRRSNGRGSAKPGRAPDVQRELDARSRPRPRPPRA